MKISKLKQNTKANYQFKISIRLKDQLQPKLFVTAVYSLERFALVFKRTGFGGTRCDRKSLQWRHSNKHNVFFVFVELGKAEAFLPSVPFCPHEAHCTPITYPERSDSIKDLTKMNFPHSTQNQKNGFGAELGFNGPNMFHHNASKSSSINTCKKSKEVIF